MRTCGTCKYWNPYPAYQSQGTGGVCDAVMKTDAAAFVMNPGWLRTMPDFGCALWEGDEPKMPKAEAMVKMIELLHQMPPEIQLEAAKLFEVGNHGAET